MTCAAKHLRLPKRFMRAQRGDVLLDAIVAVLLVMLLGAGPLYVASRATVVQKQSALDQVAASELRSILNTVPRSSICSASGPVGKWAQPQTVAIGSPNTSATKVNMTVSALCNTAAVEVGGVSLSLPQVTLVACFPQTLTKQTGPVIIREGAVSTSEPKTCS